MIYLVDRTSWYHCAIVRVTNCVYDRAHWEIAIVSTECTEIVAN